VILYLDTSAFIKHYLHETGSKLVNEWIDGATLSGTNLITRIEMVATFAKLMRMRVVLRKNATTLIELFQNDWIDYVRLPVNESTVSRADELAWGLGLRGYDSVHLASAIIWQENLQEPITLATFDHQLWKAAGQMGLAVLPPDWYHHLTEE
jgi:predicted nucleic acid-binding protein